MQFIQIIKYWWKKNTQKPRNASEIYLTKEIRHTNATLYFYLSGVQEQVKLIYGERARKGLPSGMSVLIGNMHEETSWANGNVLYLVLGDNDMGIQNCLSSSP